MVYISGEEGGGGKGLNLKDIKLDCFSLRGLSHRFYCLTLSLGLKYLRCLPHCAGTDTVVTRHTYVRLGLSWTKSRPNWTILGFKDIL